MSSVTAGTATIWWLGQGSFVFEGVHSGPIVVDPYLSNSVGETGGPQRLFPVPVAPGDLRVSAIWLTHDHIDHTDPHTLPALVAANPGSPIYAPAESVAHLAKLGITANVHPIERNIVVNLPGVTIHTTHAEHTPDSVGLVFVFEQGPTIYHTADTEYFAAIADAKQFTPDLLSICINGRWGNMNIADAVRVTNAIAPRYVLPMHWGLFAENTADPEVFVRELQASGSIAEPVLLPATGLARYTVSRPVA
ncbi:MAG: MBL fold metallo-hydrolase [Fibrella sp.]|nr:MBL fold metallo-hydrolase [Armatimonadota bacterium]